MIKLVVGLGNPGRQYEKTRHNVGFLFLDRLVSGWESEARFNALCANVFIEADKLLLLKPQTFMNKSGEAVGKVARYYKIQPSEILVVHDELDFEEGVVRFKQGGGHAGHNGLRDIIAHLGSKEFLRLRVGIGRPSTGSVAHYVLSKPSVNGQIKINHAFESVEKVMSDVVSGKIGEVMNQLHQN